MTLHIWMDENGNWRVTHLPPHDDSPCLMLVLPESAAVMFFDRYTSQEISTKVRP